MSSKSFLNFQFGVSRKSSSSPKKPLPPPPPPPPPTQSLRQPKSSSPAVSQPNADEMRRVFNKFDKNKDGKISKAEYASAIGDLGGKNAKSEVTKAFQAADSDGDGFIDFEEFMNVQKSGGGDKIGDIKSAFRVFDLDGNGKISAEELLEVLRRLGERCSLESCRKMVRGVDTDGDGMIDIDEFMGLMTHTIKLASK